MGKQTAATTTIATTTYDIIVTVNRSKTTTILVPLMADILSAALLFVEVYVLST